MKQLLVLLISIVLVSYNAKSQTVVKDQSGNYVAVKKSSATDSTSLKATGKTFTDAKGTVYPVYISVNNKLFVIKISKTGNKYRYYLKVD